MINVMRFRQNRGVIIPATLLTIAAMITLPLAVHLLPQTGGLPWGARLVPMYYAPFLAAALFQPAVSLAAALMAPLLNHWLTGSPSLDMALILTLELTVFSAAVLWFSRRLPRLLLIGPAAFLLAKAAAFITLSLLPNSWSPLEPGLYAVSSLANAWPGIAILLIMSLLVSGQAHGKALDR